MEENPNTTQLTLSEILNKLKNAYLHMLKSSANVARIIGVMCRSLSLIYHLYMLSKSDYLACTEYHMLFLKNCKKKKKKN
jgi:uncharacterized protein YqgQ